MIITDTANTAVSADPNQSAHSSKPKRRKSNLAHLVPAKAPRITKSAAVVALLQRPQGATLAELITATGWLPHTTRAALTGVRKNGHVIDKTKRGDETCYRITAAA